MHNPNPGTEASTVIRDARFLLTMDGERRLLEGMSIAIASNTIAAIGTFIDLESTYVGAGTDVIDGRNFLVTPGLINAHLHLESCFDKGLMHGAPVGPFVDRYFTFTYGTLNADRYYWAALANLIACVKTGTTTVSDCGTLPGLEHAAASAVESIGLRAVLARDMMDIGEQPAPEPTDESLGPQRFLETTDQCLERSERFLHEFNGRADGRIRAGLDLQTLNCCSPDLCRGARELANRYGVSLQAHVAYSHDTVEQTRQRFGHTEVEYLHDLGVLGPDLLAAHAQWTTGREVHLLRDCGVHVAHVPGCSLFFSIAIFNPRGRFPDYVSSGINLALGNDEGSTGTSHDLVRDMYVVATAHADAHQPMAMPERELFMFRAGDDVPLVLEMTTVNGARALLLEGDVGSIEVGKKADIVLWDLTSYEWMPTVRETVVANLVFNGTGRSAHTVFCDGRKVMEGGRIVTIDEREVRARVQEYAEQITRSAPWLKERLRYSLAWQARDETMDGSEWTERHSPG